MTNLLERLGFPDTFLSQIDGGGTPTLPHSDLGAWSRKSRIDWLVVSTHLKNISQIGSFPKVRSEHGK